MERKLLKSCCETCGKETNLLYESLMKDFKQIKQLKEQYEERER